MLCRITFKVFISYFPYHSAKKVTHLLNKNISASVFNVFIATSF